MASDQRRHHIRRRTIDVVPQSILKSPSRAENRLRAAHARMQASRPTTLPPRRPSTSFSVGQAVSIRHGRFKGLAGCIKFAGETKFAKGVWLGIELSEPKGHCDGSRLGHQYFECKPNAGVFVKSSMVDLCGIAAKQPTAAETRQRSRSVSWSTSPNVMQSPRVFDLPAPGSIPESTVEEEFDRQVDDFKQQAKASIRTSLRSWMRTGVRNQRDEGRKGKVNRAETTPTIAEGKKPSRKESTSPSAARPTHRRSTSREKTASAKSARPTHRRSSTSRDPARPTHRRSTSREGTPSAKAARPTHRRASTSRDASRPTHRRSASRERPAARSPAARRRSVSRERNPTKAQAHHRRHSEATRPKFPSRSPPTTAKVARKPSPLHRPNTTKAEGAKPSASQPRWRVSRRTRSKSLSRISAMHRTAAYSLPPSNAKTPKDSKEDYKQVFASYIASLQGVQPSPTGKPRNPLRAMQALAQEKPPVLESEPNAASEQASPSPSPSPKSKPPSQQLSVQCSSPSKDKEFEAEHGFFDLHIALDGESVASRPASKSEPTTPGGPGSGEASPGWSYLDMAGAQADVDADVLNLSNVSNDASSEFSLIGKDV